MTTEWIEHHGKGYPDLPMDTRVHVRFADGKVDEWNGGATVDFWGSNWTHSEPIFWANITHYRVVE